MPTRPRPRTRPGVEAPAVVLHRKNDPGILLAHHHPHGARLSVAGAIVQGFLNHAVDAGLQSVGQLAGRIGRGHLHANSGAFGNLARLPFQRRHQAEIVQHGGPQQQRHVADDVHAGFRQLLDRIHVLPDVGIVRSDMGGGVSGFHQQGRKRLADLVMQLARNAAPLFFLGRNQARGQLLQLLLGIQNLPDSAVPAPVPGARFAKW